MTEQLYIKRGRRYVPWGNGSDWSSDHDAMEIVSWKTYEPGSDWESRWGEVMFPAWWQPLPDHPPFPDKEPQQ